ncbi:MAG: 30S ribosomal protein S12 methylthiotransferase RimO [Bacteroidales bacterium]|nr:30S ribosomal protein S12 methylthiotransferase RimO [Candidatus Latescibacterota bacterium]
MKAVDEIRSVGSFHFFNLGCSKNLVDAERVAGSLEERGWQYKEDPALASLLVITTCAFISIAEEESVGEIIRVASGKEGWQKLVVLGCMVTREGDELGDLFPEVDLFLPVDEMMRLPEVADSLVGPVGQEQGRPVKVSGECLSHPGGRRLFTIPHLAYLKIAEGCSNHCSYCTIPDIRGELRSEDHDEMLEEAIALARAGVKELVLIAQDTSAYGQDSGNVDDLYRLAGEIGRVEGIEWIRLMYLHPAHLDTGRIEALISAETIIPYLDIPVQHVSDRILKDMGRGYQRKDLEDLFGKLRNMDRRVVLRTTVMAGFPGETEDEFNELLDFIEEQKFDHLGVFTFSPERGTTASSMKGQIDSDRALARMDEIASVQMDISHDRLISLMGTLQNVIVDGYIEDNESPLPGVWGTGRYYGQAHDVDGVTFLSGRKANRGEIVKVRINEVEAYDLFGKVE